MDLTTLEKANEIALEVLKISRNTLIVNLRFLDSALSRLAPEQYTGTLATDGVNLFYSPMHVLTEYKNEKETVVRDYLHIVMHCVFRHMFIHRMIDRERWDLACDIAVENSISELGVLCVASSREKDQQKYISGIRKKVGKLTAEKVYRYLIDEVKDKEIAGIREVFLADDHTIWYDEPEEDGDPDENKNGDGNGSGGNAPSQSGGEGADGDTDSSSEDNDGKGPFDGSSRSQLEQDWQDVAERMQQDLETFSRERGEGAGGLVQNLREVNRERYDYTSFLKKFATLGEAMKINDDEFDYIFYTYGLKLYDNMPLIEPLEYKEVKRIKEFVIAIDTSGSTSAELVHRFLNKTYNILMSEESFFTKINVHIIQCDAAIQEDAKITSRDEFEKYIKTMKIRGLGGTDFRPVFKYVDRLIAAKEFTNLKGMIYFTDGFGVFPEKTPQYKAAFVFTGDDIYDVPDVPSWAIKLVLDNEEI